MEWCNIVYQNNHKEIGKESDINRFVVTDCVCVWCWVGVGHGWGGTVQVWEIPNTHSSMLISGHLVTITRVKVPQFSTYLLFLLPLASPETVTMMMTKPTAIMTMTETLLWSGLAYSWMRPGLDSPAKQLQTTPGCQVTQCTSVKRGRLRQW